MHDEPPPMELELEPLYAVLEGRTVSLPGQDELSNALNLLFWASLTKDEGRFVTGNFAFARPEDCQQYLQFIEPEAFDNPDAVRRLAAASDPDTSALAMYGGRIWGVALSLPLQSLFVSITEPGKLLVRHGELGVLGSVSRYRLTPYVSASSRSKLELIQARHRVPNNIFQFLLNQSAWMRRIGHGGTIVMVPDEARSSLATDFQLGRQVDFEHARNWQAAGEEGAGTQESKLERVHRETEESRLAQSIARLSGVDGAVLISHDLRVMSFATKIKARDSPPQLRRKRPMKDERIIVQRDWGTRHESAACYAWAQPGSWVLVVSQDGSLSLMSRSDQDDSVLLSSGFEDLMPVNTATLRFDPVVAVGNAQLPSFESRGVAHVTNPGDDDQ